MKVFRYIARMITQTIYAALLIYFFSADNNFEYHFTINWFIIWLLVSWLCQFYLMRFSKLLIGPNSSIQQLGAKYRLNDHMRNHQRDKWGAVNTYNMSDTIDSAENDSDSFLYSIVIHLVYSLLGPLIFIIVFGFHWYKKNQQK